MTLTDTVRFLLLLGASPLVMLLVHAAWCRVRPTGAAQALAVQAIALSALPEALLIGGLALRQGHVPLGNMVAGAVYSLVVFGALAVVYFHAFNMSLTARRIRILCELQRAGSMDRAQLAAVYAAEQVLEVRIARLLQTGQIEPAPKGYRLRRRLIYRAALAVDLWRRILGWPPLLGTSRPA